MSDADLFRITDPRSISETDGMRMDRLARECGRLRAMCMQKDAAIRSLTSVGKDDPSLSYCELESARLGATVDVGYDEDADIVEVWIGGSQIAQHLDQDAIDEMNLELAEKIPLDAAEARADLQISAFEVDRMEGVL